MNKFKKYRWLLIIALFFLSVGVYVNSSYQSDNPICPDDFKDPEQEIASFSEWTKEFMTKYPTSTMSEFSKARRAFFVKNDCAEALKRYDDYMAGNVDEETKQLIEMMIKESGG